MPAHQAQRPRRRAKDIPPPPRTIGADEKVTLQRFLDYLRNSVAGKVADAPEPQVRTGGVPSGTNLLGLLKHLTFVERFYFLGEDVRSWPATMRPSTQETIDSVLAEYRQTVQRANKVIDTCQDLTLPAPWHSNRGSAPSMRWVLVHMIEETAATPVTPTFSESRSTDPPAADGYYWTARLPLPQPRPPDRAAPGRRERSPARAARLSLVAEDLPVKRLPVGPDVQLRRHQTRGHAGPLVHRAPGGTGEVGRRQPLPAAKGGSSARLQSASTSP